MAFGEEEKNKQSTEDYFWIVKLMSDNDVSFQVHQS